MNPLNNNNPINAMLQFLGSGGNPQQLANQIMQQNPQAKQALEQLQQMTNGQHPKDVAMQLAKQRGIDPAQLMQIAKKMGLK